MAGREILAAGGNALDAVTQAVVALEDDPLFNAGKGSVFTAAGTQEMDASVMDGRDHRAGAVAGVFGPRNPVLAARAVMEHSHHVLLISEGALAFCRGQHVAFAEPGYFGDSPIIGAGTYADNATCAVSATGHGEFFIRYGVAFDIAARLRYGDQSLRQAAYAVIEALVEFGGRGGMVAVDRSGALALPFNTAGMYRGYVRASGVVHTAIWDEPYLLG
jgi:beta-aspartyl-peptidase (threonine type)